MKLSQCDIIQKRLEQEPNVWIPMPLLAMLASCYAVNSRISDLRERGMDIVNKTETVHGTRRSYYKLVVPEKQLELL